MGLALALGPLPVRAEEIPAALQVTILLKALRYDANLSSRSGSELVVALFYRKGDSDSEAHHAALAEAMGEVAPKVVDLPVRVVTFSLPPEGDWAGRVSDEGVNLIFVARGVGDELSRVLGLARARSIPSMAGDPDFVESGAAIGVYAKGTKRRLIINRAQAESQGMDLSARILKLADLVE